MHASSLKAVRFAFVVGSLMLPAGAACSSPVSSVPADAGSGATTDAGLQCKNTVAEACAQRPCVTQWPADPSAFCSIAHQQPAGIEGVYDPCGSYRVFVDEGVDGGSVYYYDPATGTLVAIVQFLNYTRTCIAGPQTFVEPAPECGSGGTNSSALVPLTCSP